MLKFETLLEGNKGVQENNALKAESYLCASFYPLLNKYLNYFFILLLYEIKQDLDVTFDW